MENIVMENYDKGLRLEFVSYGAHLFTFEDEDGDEYYYTYGELRKLSRLSKANRTAFYEIMDGWH